MDLFVLLLVSLLFHLFRNCLLFKITVVAAETGLISSLYFISYFTLSTAFFNSSIKMGLFSKLS